MPLDLGRITHLLDQMHRSEDDSGDPIDDGMLIAADGARGQKWVDPSTLSSALTVKDEGTPLATAATSLDFAGAGVTASGTGAGKTVTIPGTPTGAAGGDLSGTYPNPSVVDDSHGHSATTLSGVIKTGDAAGGDLSGTYPNPSVLDDSHNHTLATVPGATGQILMEDGTSSPPVPLWNEDGTDYLYSG